MERFPEIQAAQHRREAARAQVGQARAELFPSVNGSLGEGRERSRNVSTRATGEEVTLTRREAELSVSQLLFDGGAAGGQVKRFAARAESAEFGVIGTAEDVAFRASQAFVEVRRLREQLGVARQNVGIHVKTLSDVNLLADAGRGRRADVFQAQARRALATSSVDQISGQLAQAEAGFRYLVGRPPGELAAPPAIAPRIPARLDAAVNEALASHPVVKSAEKEIEAAQHDRESARAQLAVPRVTLDAGASRNRDIDGIAGANNDQYAMLRLRYNFFRGFGDSERVRETEARIDQAIAELGRIRVELERDVRQAWEGLAADRARVVALEAYARASADVVEAYRLQFQLGQRTLLDVLNAENERYGAAANLIAARAAVTAGELRVLASMGQLMDALGVSVHEPRTAEPRAGYARVLDALGISQEPRLSEPPHGR
jgi:adhesin transport system outer membrane protein